MSQSDSLKCSKDLDGKECKNVKGPNCSHYFFTQGNKEYSCIDNNGKCKKKENGLSRLLVKR